MSLWLWSEFLLYVHWTQTHFRAIKSFLSLSLQLRMNWTNQQKELCPQIHPQDNDPLSVIRSIFPVFFSHAPKCLVFLSFTLTLERIKKTHHRFSFTNAQLACSSQRCDFWGLHQTQGVKAPFYLVRRLSELFLNTQTIAPLTKTNERKQYK